MYWVLAVCVRVYVAVCAGDCDLRRGCSARGIGKGFFFILFSVCVSDGGETVDEDTWIFFHACHMRGCASGDCAATGVTFCAVVVCA